jgi:uncharacterized protein (TIGR00369 family)
MPVSDELRAALDALPQPKCVELTPFEVVDAEPDGRVRVRFAAQPAFKNHFGNVQGGFLVAMLEVPLTLAIYVRSKRLCPTIEIKTSFLAPAPLGELIGEGSVVRIGSSVVFAEAKILTLDGTMVAHATASSLVPKS